MTNPFLSCIHSHTVFCDGKDTPERMVQRAHELGFVSVGISSHGPTWWDHFNYSLSPDAVDEYQSRIRQLQRDYDGRMEVLLGIEHDSLGAPIGEGFDYVIESVHAMMVGGILCYTDWDLEKTQTAIREVFGGDPYGFAKAYFETCAAAYEHHPAQIAGHVDLITKFNERVPMFDETDPRFLNPALEAVNTALEQGLIVEVNTGAISRGYRTAPYPSVPILQHLLAKNAPIVVTSDCHDANYLDCWYPETAELLRSVGFKSTLRLRKSGWEEIGL